MLPDPHFYPRTFAPFHEQKATPFPVWPESFFALAQYHKTLLLNTFAQ